MSTESKDVYRAALAVLQSQLEEAQKAQHRATSAREAAEKAECAAIKRFDALSAAESALYLVADSHTSGRSSSLASAAPLLCAGGKIVGVDERHRTEMP